MGKNVGGHSVSESRSPGKAGAEAGRMCKGSPAGLGGGPSVGCLAGGSSVVQLAAVHAWSLQRLLAPNQAGSQGLDHWANAWGRWSREPKKLADFPLALPRRALTIFGRNLVYKFTIRHCILCIRSSFYHYLLLRYINTCLRPLSWFSSTCSLIIATLSRHRRLRFASPTLSHPRRH